MTAQAILDRLRSFGVCLSVAGDKLRVEAPAGVLTPELRQELIEHKAALLALLRPYSPPVILGSRGEDPLDFRCDPLTGEWFHEPGWWQESPQVCERQVARPACPQCGGTRFWVSLCHSEICAECYPPRPGEKVLGWLVSYVEGGNG